ncbi:GNAT family N-acetyltransferase [Leucobacter komagatae]|uniref:GNAT family N-acetyltransferase n=1 Tax=Leucobacter komagatae TaxID=55969 RepID=UPI00069763C4|nr:GNAT family N-acetyltransferase [Leucobacter komagatae]
MIQIEQHDPLTVLTALPSPLAPLWTALFDHHVSMGAAGMVTKPRAGSWPQRRDHYRDTIEGSPHASLWIATDDAAPVGYALSFEDSLGGSSAPGAPADAASSRVEVLETLSLLPETRGQGIGAELVTIVEESARARGIERVAIDVMGGNEGALRFYTRAGYAPYSKTWMRSMHPAPGEASRVLGDTGDAAAVFAALGVSLSQTGHSDDTWVTAPSVVVLDVAAGAVPAAGGVGVEAGEFERWIDEFMRGIDLLADAGYWTVWAEALVSERAEGLGDALVARGFSHGMTRVLKSIGGSM